MIEPDDLPNEQLQSMTGQEAAAWFYRQSQSFLRLMAYYRCAMMEVETKFNVLNEEFSLQHDRNPISSVRSRLKSPRSIQEKLQRKGLPLTMEAIEEGLNDVAGVRVICSFPEDVWLLVDAFLKQDDVELIALKDYITYPKPSGYRSLHLIVSIPIYLADEKRSMKVEVQLRTIAMNCWASLEHQLRYKKDRVFSEAMAADLALCARLSAELDLRMDTLRRSIELGEYIPYHEPEGSYAQPSETNKE
ncbi:MAG: GTP pyrophosphokinase family protein [Aristaeellaceae bacterium]